MEEQYYVSIKEKLLKSEIYDKARDYVKDRNKVKVYYEIRELLSKVGKDYGKNIIKYYLEKLMIEVGKKYNENVYCGDPYYCDTHFEEKVVFGLFNNGKLITPIYILEKQFRIYNDIDVREILKPQFIDEIYEKYLL